MSYFEDDNARNDDENAKNQFDDQHTENEDQEYERGYKKPPKEHQFPKGVSGNPRGRPKRSKNMSTIMRDALARPVVIKEYGKERRVAFREAFVRKLAIKALEGSTRDMIALMKAMHDYLPETIEPDQTPITRYIRFIESDGNGKPANPEDLEPITDFSKYRIVDRPSADHDPGNGDTGSSSLNESEEAWRASGIDDEPDT